MRPTITNIDFLLQTEPSIDIMRAQKVRDIMLTDIRCRCLRNEIPTPFHSGDEISMDLQGQHIKASVLFDPQHIEVRMNAPVAITTGRDIAVSRRLLYHQPSLSLTRMVRNEEVATPDCIRKAWEKLYGLYCDYRIADSIRGTIIDKYERYQREEKEIREREKELNRPILKEIDMLRKEKSLLKKRFKQGLVPEEEYKKGRRRLIDMINAKQGELSKVDVFGRIFYDEIPLIQCVESGRDLIRIIAEGKI